VNIFILHPHNRVSEVQRRQMTTILSKNVFNIALEGSFDDCQNIVKEIMGDIKFKQKYKLSAVNSINWARIVAQVVYYFYAALQFDEPVSFSVPTGNFGDILAGWIALQMGCPIKKLIIATNKNDILHRFLETGTYSKKAVHQTLSPSMDIQISSNFERLLFEYHDCNPDIIQKKIKELAKKGEFSVSKKVLGDIKKVFGSEKIDDIQTLAVIAHVYKDTKELLDPHTAIGFMAGRDNLDDEPMISLATAHPAKFPDAVKRACGKTAPLPDFLEDLFDRKEKYVVLPNSKQAILDAIIKNN
jgi:threonine synthase